jgi:hypothetical protein
VNLDAKIEDPEARPFEGDIVADSKSASTFGRRADDLALGTLAVARGYAGDWARKQVGQDFCEACEDLAMIYIARGVRLALDEQ